MVVCLQGVAMSEEKKKITNEGRTACIILWSTGVMHDCSYPEGSPEREIWMEGWNEVNEVNEKAKDNV